MEREPDGFEIGFNEAMSHWYVVHREWKGDVLHRNILSEMYESEAAAQDAAKRLAETQENS